MIKVFIDGKSGTTGLRIYERLSAREDIRLITLPDALRHDVDARSEAIRSADAAFLCLPDDAAREIAAAVSDADTLILDTSTAHRTDDGWCYGFPQLSKAREEAVKKARRIAVPGCHASGFCAVIAPLVEAGAVNPEANFSVFSLTGYSGGGKNMIADYENNERSPLLDFPRQYAMGQSHKHLPEMVKICGIKNAPVFVPVVGDFYSGMEVTVPLFAADMMASLEEIKNIYRNLYTDEIVKYVEGGDEGGFLSSGKLAATDSMEISVYGNAERAVLCARYDNLGKGASGAAIECMNIALGIEKTIGLELVK